MRGSLRWIRVQALGPAVLAGACASRAPVRVNVEFLDPISVNAVLPPGDLRVYPSGGTEPPVDLVRIANLHARWESEEQRFEARRLLFAMASRIGADSILDYREETESRRRRDPPAPSSEQKGLMGLRSGGWKAVPWAVGILVLAVIEDSAARREPEPRGRISGCAARRL